MTGGSLVLRRADRDRRGPLDAFGPYFRALDRQDVAGGVVHAA
ncbi:hypothetical protein ACFWG5_09465 [Streptomyces hydrogenans]